MKVDFAVVDDEYRITVILMLFFFSWYISYNSINFDNLYIYMRIETKD